MSMSGETEKYELHVYSNQLAFRLYKYICRERENPSSTLKPFTVEYVFSYCNHNSMDSIEIRCRYTK